MSNDRQMTLAETYAAWQITKNSRRTRELLEQQNQLLADQQSTPRFIFYRHAPDIRRVINCEPTATGAPDLYVKSLLDNGWYRWHQTHGAYLASAPPPTPTVA